MDKDELIFQGLSREEYDVLRKTLLDLEGSNSVGVCSIAYNPSTQEIKVCASGKGIESWSSAVKDVLSKDYNKSPISK